MIERTKSGKLGTIQDILFERLKLAIYHINNEQDIQYNESTNT
jgi:hypothetical protein